MSRLFRIISWTIIVMICLSGISVQAAADDDFYLEGLYWGMTLDGVYEWASNNGMNMVAAQAQYQEIIDSQTYTAVSTSGNTEMFLGTGRLVFNMKYGRLCGLTVYGGSDVLNETTSYMNELFAEFETNLISYFGEPTVDRDANRDEYYLADVWDIGNTKIMLTYESDSTLVSGSYQPTDFVKLFIIDNNTCVAGTHDEYMEILVSDINTAYEEEFPLPTYPPIEEMNIPAPTISENEVEKTIEETIEEAKEIIYVELSIGSKGEDVKKLQEKLISISFLTGSADGIYGNGTAAAVAEYQQVKGLMATGIADKKTQEYLFAEKDGAIIEPDIPLIVTDIIVSESYFGDPEITPIVKNVSRTYTIDAFSFYVRGYNTYGELVKGYGVYDLIDCIWQDGEIAPGKTWGSNGNDTWTLSEIDTAKRFEITIYKIHTTDGKTFNIKDFDDRWVTTK